MGSKFDVKIEIGGVKLAVSGTYYKGEDQSIDSPGESPSIEIDSIVTKSGDDISGLLADSELMRDIESAAHAAHVDNLMWQQAEAAVARKEMNHDF